MVVGERAIDDKTSIEVRYHIGGLSRDTKRFDTEVRDVGAWRMIRIGFWMSYSTRTAFDCLARLDFELARTDISKPARGRRNWENKRTERDLAYANRRRVGSQRGRRLFRLRAELCEHGFAHLFSTGGMGRTHLRGHSTILKRLPIHMCGFNLGLVMRKLFGRGTPEGLHVLFADYPTCFPAYFFVLFRAVVATNLFITSSFEFLFMREENRMAV